MRAMNPLYLVGWPFVGVPMGFTYGVSADPCHNLVAQGWCSVVPHWYLLVNLVACNNMIFNGPDLHECFESHIRSLDEGSSLQVTSEFSLQ